MQSCCFSSSEGRNTHTHWKYHLSVQLECLIPSYLYNYVIVNTWFYMHVFNDDYTTPKFGHFIIQGVFFIFNIFNIGDEY